jgi:hypothetical protein
MNYDALFFPISGTVLITIFQIVNHWNRPVRLCLKAIGCGVAAWFLLWLFILVPGDPIGY